MVTNMDPKARLQLIAATSILTLVLMSFVVSFFDRTYSPPAALIALGTAAVTWLFGSAVKDELKTHRDKATRKRNGTNG